jgi:hypothetical protein
MLRVKKGTFVANTSTGDQTVTGINDGSDFVGKALLLWTTYQTATGYTDEKIWQMGFTDGTNDRSVCSRASDNEAATNTDRSVDTANIIRVRDAAGTVLRVASHVSFASGEFKLNWSTVDAVAALWHYVVLGGTDFYAEVCTVDAVILSVSAGTLTRRPKAMIIIEGIGDSSAADNQCTIGFAATDNETIFEQGALYTVNESGANPSDTWRYQRTNRCATIGTAASGVVFNEVAFGPQGFYVVNSGAANLYVLALSGNISARVGSALQPTSTGVQTISSLGSFTPLIAFAMSVGQTAQTTVQTQARHSFGAMTSADQGNSWTGDEDAVTPSVTARRHTTTKVLSAADPDATGSSSVTDAEAEFESFSSGQFQVDWTTADAVAREWLYLTIGDAPAVGGGETSHVFVG